MIKRIIANVLTMPWAINKHFNAEVCRSIESAISSAESSNTGEVRFVVEGNLGLAWIVRGLCARQRAIDLFSKLRIWDTEHNSGVLVYVLLSEHKIEIVADRGITRRVPQDIWDGIAVDMGKSFGANAFAQGSIEGLKRIQGLLKEHFPGDSLSNENELCNRVLII